MARTSWLTLSNQLADVTREGMRFVDQHDDGSSAAAGSQPVRKVLHGPLRHRPLGLTDARDAEFPRHNPPHERHRQQGVGQRLPGPYPARRQPRDVHPTSVATGAREPVEQHGLAVAARPHQRHVVRRRVAAKQVRQALRQYPLLPLAPGQRRRSCARTGSEYPLWGSHDSRRTGGYADTITAGQQFSVSESGIDAGQVISERANEGVSCKSLQYKEVRN